MHFCIWLARLDGSQGYHQEQAVGESDDDGFASANPFLEALVIGRIIIEGAVDSVSSERPVESRGTLTRDPSGWQERPAVTLHQGNCDPYR